MPKYCTKDTYCRLNKTKLVASGKGYDLICPICGAEYPETSEPVKTTPAKNQRAIDRWNYGLSVNREPGEGGERYKALRRRAGYKTLVELPHEIIALDYLSSINATLACTTGGAYVIREDGSYYPLGVEDEPLSAEAGLVGHKSHGEYQEQKNRQMSKALGLMDTAKRAKTGCPVCGRVGTHLLCDAGKCHTLRARAPNDTKGPELDVSSHFTQITTRPADIEQNRAQERPVSKLSDNDPCYGVW